MEMDDFVFIKDYKHDAVLRKSFHVLTRTIYGFDFEEWYQNGYWTECYIPYSLMFNDRIISNVSVSIMDYNICGHKKRYIQLGTVMTDKNFRKQGLCRHLIDRVIDDWKSSCDLIYLFANDSVLNFYPKFNFKKAFEYQYKKNIVGNNEDPALKWIKLDMSLEENRERLIHKMVRSKRIADVQMLDNKGLIMFYGLNFMKENFYYILDLDAYVIIERVKNRLYLHDYYCEEHIQLDDITNCFLEPEIKQIVLGFTPIDKTGYVAESLIIEDTTLFVTGKDEEIFGDSKIMFPLLSHA